MTTQLTCATLQGLFRLPRSGTLLLMLSNAAELHAMTRACKVHDKGITFMHLCTFTRHISLRTCVMCGAGAEQLAGLWMWACGKQT